MVLGFEHEDNPVRWTYSLEFRGLELATTWPRCDTRLHE